jgi:phosphinothricin acetyltransferase
LTGIYAWHVQHGTGTFELDAPDAQQMAERYRQAQDEGWPWLVAERVGHVVGYACAQAFRPRAAFRHCVEDSVYVVADCQRLGIGRLLLVELIAQCEAGGATQMVAVIGDAANAGSIGLHRALGFEPAGLLKAVGWKFERWLDVVLMQRRLGSGAELPPLKPE